MTSTCQNDKYPECFGELETVFPKTKDGLRHTPDECLECSHKTACLRFAMKGIGGMKVQEEIVDRAYDSGMMSFLERWSKKKALKHRLQKKIKRVDPRRES
jgi:hypothetical protein